MNKWVIVAIEALSSFVITAGGAFIAIGGTTLPTTYQIVVCCATGLIQAARGVQARLAAPPQ